MNAQSWVLVGIGLAILAALGLRLLIDAIAAIRRKKAFLRGIEQRPTSQAHYAFIINPSKPHAREIAEHIRQFCAAHGIARPLFIDTQLDKDGSVCAREAIDAGADVIVACGGDGTVRTVASGVAGSGKTMGIVPIGTANLFCRNVGIPINNIDEALQIVISDGTRPIDMGTMRLLDSDAPAREHDFLLISGIGFDGTMIESTNPTLKKSIGWMAYFFGAVGHLHEKKSSGAITIEKADGTRVSSADVTFRTFLIGNCGKIPLVSLMPEADISDGLLDFELMDTTSGLFGWSDLASDVIYQTVRGHAGGDPTAPNSTIKALQGVRAELRLDRPAIAEVDGDILGESAHIEVTVKKHAVNVRMPAPVNESADSHAPSRTTVTA